MQTSFFEPAGAGRYLATPATQGPWSPGSQHGGPPSALAARELDLHEPAGNMRLARVAVDILRPVPVGPLTARTRTIRPGKRVALLETVLQASGQDVLIARGWRTARLTESPAVSRAAAARPLPQSEQPPAFPGATVGGYLEHIEWRFSAGGFAEPGPCIAWGRPRIPLLPGEEISPMSRTLLLADSGNGLSMVLDPRAYLFVNVDLTVVLQRDPAGDWLQLESVSSMGPTGTGLAETQLSDQSGAVGTGVQTLLISPR